MTPSSPTKFATALRAFFAQHLPLTRGLSPRTVSSYRDTFVLLLRFLAARHGCGVANLELQHLRAEDVLTFLDHLETEGKNSIATRNARLAAIHAFARFLATRDPEQVEEAQRLLAVPIKRGPTRAVDYLEGDEIGAMLEAVSPQRQVGHKGVGVFASAKEAEVIHRSEPRAPRGRAQRRHRFTPSSEGLARQVRGMAQHEEAIEVAEDIRRGNRTSAQRPFEGEIAGHQGSDR